MSDCNFTQPILGTECIGDSLPKINGNFDTLDTVACELSARLDGLVIPKYEAGDSIEFDYDPDRDITRINATNNLTYRTVFDYATSVRTNATVVDATVPVPMDLNDGTTILATRLIYPGAIDKTSTAYFTDICKHASPPKLTLYWSATANPQTTLFAFNSGNYIPTNTWLIQRQSIPWTNYPVYSSVQWSNNALIVGGQFTRLPYANVKNRLASITLNAGSTNTITSPSTVTTYTGTIGTIGTTNITRADGNSGINGPVHSIAKITVNSVDFLIVGGNFTDPSIGLFVINANTNAISSFSMNGIVRKIIADESNAAFYVVGSMTRLNSGNILNSASNIASVPCAGVAKFNIASNGTVSIDTTFTQNIRSDMAQISNIVYAIDQTSTHIYFGGNTSVRSQNGAVGLMRANKTTGAIDPDWRPNFNAAVRALCVDQTLAGTYLYVGGSFGTVTPIPSNNTKFTRHRLCAFKINPDPVFLESWAPGVGLDGLVRDIKAEDNTNGSKLIICGNFSRVRDNNTSGWLNISCANIAALTKASSSETIVDFIRTWRYKLNNTARALNIVTLPTTTTPVQAIHVVGDFTTINGGPRRCVHQAMLPTPAFFNDGVSSIPLLAAWSLDMSVIGKDGSLDLDGDASTTVTLSAEAPSLGQVSTIDFDVPENILESPVNAGDLIRGRVIRRREGTYNGTAWILGYSIH